jgi:hypothetical protein
MKKLNDKKTPVRSANFFPLYPCLKFLSFDYKEKGNRCEEMSGISGSKNICNQADTVIPSPGKKGFRHAQKGRKPSRGRVACTYT